MRRSTKRFLFGVLILALVIMKVPFSYTDEAIVKCSIKEKGEGILVVKVLETGIYKKGSVHSFYFHPKTKIVMADSETPLVMDSLLIGDEIQVALGKVEKTKDGKMIQYVDKVVVFSPHRVKR